MYFPYYFLVENQWFEKLTKGTALGGLSPPNNKPTSPPIKKKKHREPFVLGSAEKVFVIILFSLGCPNWLRKF